MENISDTVPIQSLIPDMVEKDAKRKLLRSESVPSYSDINLILKQRRKWFSSMRNKSLDVRMTILEESQNHVVTENKSEVKSKVAQMLGKHQNKYMVSTLLTGTGYGNCPHKPRCYLHSCSPAIACIRYLNFNFLFLFDAILSVGKFQS